MLLLLRNSIKILEHWQKVLTELVGTIFRRLTLWEQNRYSIDRSTRHKSLMTEFRNTLWICELKKEPFIMSGKSDSKTSSLPNSWVSCNHTNLRQKEVDKTRKVIKQIHNIFCKWVKTTAKEMSHESSRDRQWHLLEDTQDKNLKAFLIRIPRE